MLGMNNQQNPRIALTLASKPREEDQTAAEGDMEKNCRRREAEDGFRHLERSCYRCKRQSGLEETSQRPYSPRGDIGNKSFTGQRSGFRKASFSKCFSHTGKRTAGVFTFLWFEGLTVFEKLGFVTDYCV